MAWPCLLDDPDAWFGSKEVGWKAGVSTGRTPRKKGYFGSPRSISGFLPGGVFSLPPFGLFSAAPTTTASGTDAQNAYFSFPWRAFGGAEGSTQASCEWSMAFPIRIKFRS